MTANRDYFRDRRHAQGDYSRRNEERFEVAKVNLLLTKFHLPATTRRELESVHYEATGRRLLRLRLFNEMFPSFPLFLGTSLLDGAKLHVDPKAILPRWFDAFESLPFFKKYEDFYEQVADLAGNRSIGLIFPRKGFAKGLIIHNASPTDFWCNRTVSIAYRCGTAATPRYICVESFAAVVEAIYNNGRGWRPERA